MGFLTLGVGGVSQYGTAGGTGNMEHIACGGAEGMMSQGGLLQAQPGSVGKDKE